MRGTALPQGLAGGARRQVQPDPLDVWIALRPSILDRVGRAIVLIGCAGAWTNLGIDIQIQTLSVNQVCAILAFGVAVLQLVRFPDRLPAQTRGLTGAIVAVAAAMLVVLLASMANAVEPFDTLRSLGRWVYGVLFLLSVTHFFGVRFDDTKPLVTAYLVGGAITIAVSFAGFAYPPLAEIVFEDLYSYRARGLIQHPNQLAMLYVSATILSFWPDLFNRKLRTCVAGLMVLGVLLTGSKTNLLLAALAIPAILLWLPAREGRLVQAGVGFVSGIFASLIAGTAAIYYLQTYNSYYYSKIVAFASDPNEADTTTSRFAMWDQALDCAMQYPVFGIGGGNAPICIDYLHAHNVFINYLLETGFAGLALLLVFFGLSLSAVTRVARSCAPLIGRLEGADYTFRATGLLLIAEIWFIVSNSSSDSMSAATMPTYWLFIALTAALGTASAFGRTSMMRQAAR